MEILTVLACSIVVASVVTAGLCAVCSGEKDREIWSKVMAGKERHEKHTAEMKAKGYHLCPEAMRDGSYVWKDDSGRLV